MGRLVRERRPIHIPDIADEPAYRERVPARVATVELGGVRTFLAVPLLKEGALVGAKGIKLRREVGSYRLARRNQVRDCD